MSKKMRKMSKSRSRSASKKSRKSKSPKRKASRSASKKSRKASKSRSRSGSRTRNFPKFRASVLAKMKAEREKQDTMWGQTDTPSSGEWYIQPYTPDGTLRK
jgi:hypothetical protein